MLISKAPQRRFVNRPSTDETWQLIHRVADKNYPLFRQLFLNAWDNWREDVSIEDLVTNLLAGNVDQSIAITVRPWTQTANVLLDGFQQTISDTTLAAAEATQSITEQIIVDAGGPSIGIDFTATNTRVLQFSALYSGQLITLIGETEREAIRQLITDALTKGQPPLQTAREIRQFIGLTRPQAQALIRFREALEASGMRADLIERRIETRTRRMINHRARMIARNESMQAAVRGQYELWIDVQNQGLVVEGAVRRFWVVTPDDRLCQICAPIPRMNPNGVGLLEAFDTPAGPKLIAHAHIVCRCAENYTIEPVS